MLPPIRIEPDWNVKDYSFQFESGEVSIRIEPDWNVKTLRTILVPAHLN